ncbi:MAG: M23 family metallopeptidase [Bacteroidota bacterium]|nr:M23 family metallopeptidase [Bacteroidota bacterium]
MIKNFSIYIFVLIFASALLFFGFFSPSENKNEPAIPSSPNAINEIYYKFDSFTSDAAKYIWPTDASNRVTSSFGEFRNNHFHGGIDVSTNKKTGFRVFASREGYIARIRMMPDGYGKMLYVKHPDDYYTTYAHLKTFNNEINEIVQREQYKRQSFYIDLKLDAEMLPVQSGDIIAYTGDTGAGPPHLHFEIRDENMNPVNPFLFQNLYISDNRPPIIKKIFVAPAGMNSEVFGKITPYFYNNRNRGGRNLTIAQTIPVSGDVRLGIEAIDLANEASNRSGIYSIELMLNDNLIYKVKFDRFPDAEAKQIMLHYDLQMLYASNGQFQKLYVEEGNLLPIYNRMPYGSGIIKTGEMPEGLHTFKISVKDFSDNETSLEGKILVSRKPEIQIQNISDGQLTLTGSNLNSIEQILVFGKSSGQADWKRHTIRIGIIQRNGANITFPFDVKKYTIMKIVAENKFGFDSPPVYHFNRKLDGGNYNNIKIVREHFQDFINLTITTAGYFTDVPVVQILEDTKSNSIQLKAVELNKYSGSFIPDISHWGEKSIKIKAEVNGKFVESSDNFFLYPIAPNKTGEFTLANGNLKIAFDSGAVFKPLFVTVDSSISEGRMVYSLNSQDVLLNKGIRVSMKSTNQNDALYIVRKRDWVFQTKSANSNYLTTTLTRTLTDVGLFEDDTKPFISNLKLRTRNRRPSIAFRFGDGMSGIDYKNFRMYINNDLIIPEIEGSRLWYDADNPLPKGNHTLRIDISDKAGNQNEFVTNFRVK